MGREIATCSCNSVIKQNSARRSACRASFSEANTNQRSTASLLYNKLNTCIAKLSAKQNEEVLLCT